MLAYGENRRRFRRVKISVRVKMSKSSSEMAYVYGETHDVSMGGACIALNQSLPSFSILKVIFEATTGVPLLELEARLLWIREQKNEETGEEIFLAGVQFLNLNTEEKKKIIRELMEKRS